MTQNLLLSLEGVLQSSAGEGRARLVDSLPAISRWSKNVWEGIPDSGVEVRPPRSSQRDVTNRMLGAARATRI